MYEDLVNKTQKLLKQQDVVVVVISGHGGSGKSTLANKLAREFGVAQEQIVRTDDIHSKDYGHAGGLFELHDWPVIFDLLKNVRTSKRLHYTTRSWKGVEGIVDTDKPRLVILEGIRLIRPEVLLYVDLSVWVDCPLDVATKRAVDRNREQGDIEAELAEWDTKWVPEAKEYMEQVHPEKIADFVYSQWQ